MFAASKTASVSGGYQISRSLRFNSADSAYLNRSLASSGNQQKFTFSYWFKRGTIAAQQVAFGLNSGGNEIFTLAFLSGDTLRVFARNGGTDVLNLTTTAVYRDPSAWYHIVVAIDTTQATSSNRALMYVNGVQVTAFGTATYPAQNTNLVWNNSAYSHQIGREDTGNYLNGYLTETNFIDGQALTPSSFGQTDAQTGVWTPIAYSGSYGTNGFYLNFSDNSNTTAATLGKDYSGNGNNWTPNNFSVTAGAGNDSLVDSPTSYGTDTGVGGTVRGNYATLNPLDKGADISASNGNLDVTASTAWRGIRATLGMSSGKWYCEYTPTSGTYHIVSISQPQAVMDGYIVNNSTAWGYGYDGSKYNGGSTTSYGSAWGVGDTIGIAFDADAGTLTFYKNNTSQGVAYSGLTSGPYLVGIGVYPSATGTFNFGQRPFAYTAPSGYKALCTQNLPTPTIGATTATQAGKYFNPVTYTGDGVNGRAVTGVGFQPDMVWVKGRSTVSNHALNDVLRGGSRTLFPNTTEAEYYDPDAFVKSFTSDGFTVGSLGGVNGSGATYVGWSWKANGSGSTNTAGSITSTVSANTTSGFSVVTYTGTGSAATVGHGLGAAPKMVIYKARNTTGGWFTYHTSVGPTKELELNTTNGEYAIDLWQNTNPSSTVFYLSNNIYVNNSGTNYVAYCFAEVSGYSKAFSYTGNGSTDGVFVYTGFRPAYVIVKCSSSGGTDWIVEDATRSTTNVVDARLFPNTSDAEISNGNGNIDFLSNGFKLRNSHAGMNASGSTYIGFAFASVPTKFSLAR